MTFFHKSVFLQQVIEILRIDAGKRYIDATLGGGGHTRSILERGGLVLGIDQDKDAIQFIQENLKFKIQNSKLKLVRGNFRNIKKIAEENGFNSVSGILFDLGVSSYQLDASGRGFSLRADEPLDMRMDLSSNTTAADILNTYSSDELCELFMRYGEEEDAKVIADAIVAERKKGKIQTTGQLVKIIESVKKRNGKKIAPATKVFQAIRIGVNQELSALEEGILDSFDLLKQGGRLAVISFHSLEDRIIKQTFNTWQNKGLGMALTEKPIVATLDEVRSNPRARSAKMRAFGKHVKS